MRDLDAILPVIYQAIDALNAGLKGKQLEKSPGTILFGAGSVIDSIGLVSLVVDVEQGLEETFGKSLTLADERAMSKKNSPFRTVGSLAEYINGELERVSGG